MTKDNRRSLDFGLRWVLANAIAWLIVFGLYSFNSYHFGAPAPLLVFGAVVSLLQAGTLGRRVKHRTWVMAGVLGALVGVISSWMVASNYSVMGWEADGAILLWGLTGAASGIFQSWTLRQNMSRKVGLFLMLSAGTAIAAMFGQYILWLGNRYTMSMLASTTLASFNQMTEAMNLVSIATYIVGGALYGMITAIPIMWLFRIPSSQRSSQLAAG